MVPQSVIHSLVRLTQYDARFHPHRAAGVVQGVRWWWWGVRGVHGDDDRGVIRHACAATRPSLA